ncbi:MAG: helix-turn-helix domain-containing protein [Proteocatella sp.]
MTITIPRTNNKKIHQSKIDKINYKYWKWSNLNTNGYFIIFNGFCENGYLNKISGNALKLYLYLGIYSKNETGESFHSISTIAKYFGKNERTIYNWLRELLDLKLIRRIQFEFNGPTYTYLQTYNANNKKTANKKESQK